jgi:ubiquinone/menaquinone biosynthesis C-methylase UbiE
VGVVDFYDRHPINERDVVAAVSRRRGTLAHLKPDDLFDFDQDHYGGLAAVDQLARRATIEPTSRVLDLCAGLGGPARFLAARRGCRVVAVELNAGRAAGAARLTRLVGLERRVRIVRGDATALPLAAGQFDVGLSQEGFLHIENKPGVLAECRRVLVPGGRLAFTDWIAGPRLGDLERRRLAEWMAAVTLQTLDGYRTLLGRAGFAAVESEDLTDAWRPILKLRLHTHRALRPETIARFGQTWADEYDQIYDVFINLVEAGKVGGGRLIATRA